MARTTPGGVVGFTATLTNTGQTPYIGIRVGTDSADVFDDACRTGTNLLGHADRQRDRGGVDREHPGRGDGHHHRHRHRERPRHRQQVLASTITTAAPGSNCPAVGPAAACSVSIPVLTPGLTITNTPDTTAATPGSMVGFTLTITDTARPPIPGSA